MNDTPADGLAELLALSPTAWLLLDSAGSFIYATPAAAPLLGASAMLAIKDGTLTARRKGEDKALREAVADLSAQRHSTTLSLRDREGVPVLVIDMRRLPGGSIALRLTPIGNRPAPGPDRLRRLFGLTPAEARVAIALLGGMGLSGVAREHGVEPETVRTQVKRIRSKTGTRSQNQMLGVLAAAGVDLALG